MSCTVRPGTLRRMAERPPNRFAEPGRISSVVTPPRREVLKPGSCGHTECSAQTCAVLGSVASLPSECACTAGDGIDAQMRVHVDQAGRHPFAVGVDRLVAGGQREVLADGFDLAVADQDHALGDLAAGAREDVGADDGRGTLGSGL